MENKLPLTYVYLGEHTVKNIVKPVRVYRVRVQSGGNGLRVSGRRRHAALPLRRRGAAALAGVLLIAAGSVTGWHLLIRSPSLVTALRAPEADGAGAGG